MRNLEFTAAAHRPTTKSLKGRAYDGIGYIEIEDSRERDDVLLDLAQTWYRERPELFRGTESQSPA